MNNLPNNLTIKLIITGLLSLLLSCGGGGSFFTVPDTNGGTKILGVNFGTKVPSLIAFTRIYETGVGPNGDIFVMFPDGSHVNRLTNTPGDDNLPSFSPDGMFLAIVSNSLDTGWGNREVMVLSKPSKMLRMTEGGWQFDNVGLDWGPGFLLTGRLNTLIGAPFDFIGLTKIYTGDGHEESVDTGFIASYSPSVSRDGKTIAFSARVNCPSEDDPGCGGNLDLFITFEGVPAQFTAFNGTPEDPINLINAQFDYSGKHLVFQTNYWSDDWEIGLIDIEKFAWQFMCRLTDNPADDVEPCFDQSGDWVAFSSNRDGNFEIYKLHIASPSTDPTRLTNTPEDEHNPDWSMNY